MADARYIVGIDLGTTHTVVAYTDLRAATDDRAPAISVFPIEQQIAQGEFEARDLLPSARYHAAEGELENNQATVVGAWALALGAKSPGRLVTSAKSWLSHAGVDRTAAILPWGAPQEVPKVSPVEASASYLAHVREAWNRRFESAPLEAQDIVLTVPASFDEGARALTLQAAKQAGLSKLKLVEEPQAAFYDWLSIHRDSLDADLGNVRLALVCDVGGGTTDLTLIQVELRESGPRLTRIAVGEHLMLGGDNMDLAIAKSVENKLSSTPLDSARFSQLVQQCRSAKEQLLARDAPSRLPVTLLGSGSRLVGAARTADLERADVERLVVDGFFPRADHAARPEKRKGAIVEFGLPYAADAAITKHVAAFLAAHTDVIREALGSDHESTTLVPDALLLNGGVFRGAALEARIQEVLASWRGTQLALLHNEAPDLAVARGAVAFGLARRGVGVKIGGGSARSYFLLVDAKTESNTKPAICVLPRGAEEGEEILLKSRTFSLRTGQPVRFSLVSSASDRAHRPGDLIDASNESFVELPPIAAVIGTKQGNVSPETPVQLASALTEIGTIEMNCLAEDKRRWKLEFQLRGTSQKDVAERVVTQLHPRFKEATDRIHRVYGKSSENVDKRDVKQLRADLEKLLGDRDTWDVPLLRELFGALLAGVKRRRRSADHERVWFNLAGYCLRPGLGYPLDDWRVRELFTIYEQGVQFAPEAQVWSEWWTLWRRVAGGLPAEAQNRILNDIEPYIEPPSARPKPRAAGPRKLGVDDMIRLAGVLEFVNADRKAQVGSYITERILRHEENPQAWWAVGRIGTRVPLYGSAHNVVSRDVATSWLEAILGLDWRTSEMAAFAATLLARVSGDRERDIEPSVREKVANRLKGTGAPAAWARMVQEVMILEAADEKRIFGESLPPGLRLVS